MLKILGKIALITAWALSCWFVFQWARPVEYRSPLPNTLSTPQGVSKITYTEATPLLPSGWEINPEARFSYDKPPYLRPLDDQWKQEYLEALQIEDDAERYTKLSDLAESLRAEDFPAAILAMKALIEPSGADEYLASEGYGHLCFRWGSLDFHNAYAYMQQLEAPDVDRNVGNVVLGYAHRDISGALQWVSTLDESVQEEHLDLIFNEPAFIMHHDIDTILNGLSNIDVPYLYLDYYHRDVFSAFSEKIGAIKAMEKSVEFKLDNITRYLINNLPEVEIPVALNWVEDNITRSNTLDTYKFYYALETNILERQLEITPKVLLEKNIRYISTDNYGMSLTSNEQGDAIANLIKTNEQETLTWLDSQPASELKNVIIASSLSTLFSDPENNVNYINLLINKIPDDTYLELVISDRWSYLKDYDVQWLATQIPRLNESKIYNIVKNNPHEWHIKLSVEINPHSLSISEKITDSYSNEMNQFLENEYK